MNSRVPLLLAVTAPLWAACATDAGTTASRLPARSPGAPRGSELVASWQGLDLESRDRAVVRQVLAGNVPDRVRTFLPVVVWATVAGRERRATFRCSADYVGVGGDDDWLRTPLAPAAAQQIADALDCVLPTPRMVDAVWAAADLKLGPHPFHPDDFDITALSTFVLSHEAIESARAGRDGLIAGIKKDVVVCARTVALPGRVAIYGWHRPGGDPIQPLYTGHSWRHVDYSHGIRLVARACEVDGVPTTVDAVLADPVLHVLLSGEGPLVEARYGVSPR